MSTIFKNNNLSTLRQPIESQDKPTNSKSHVLLIKKTGANLHLASIRMIYGEQCNDLIIVGFKHPNYIDRSVAIQFPHDAGKPQIPYIGIKFLLSRD